MPKKPRTTKIKVGDIVRRAAHWETAETDPILSRDRGAMYFSDAVPLLVLECKSPGHRAVLLSPVGVVRQFPRALRPRFYVDERGVPVQNEEPYGEPWV